MKEHDEKSCRNCVNAEIRGTKKLVYCTGGDEPNKVIHAPVKMAADCKAFKLGY